MWEVGVLRPRRYDKRRMELKADELLASAMSVLSPLIYRRNGCDSGGIREGTSRYFILRGPVGHQMGTTYSRQQSRFNRNHFRAMNFPLRIPHVGVRATDKDLGAKTRPAHRHELGGRHWLANSCTEPGSEAKPPIPALSDNSECCGPTGWDSPAANQLQTLAESNAMHVLFHLL